LSPVIIFAAITAMRGSKTALHFVAGHWNYRKLTAAQECQLKVEHGHTASSKGVAA